MTTLRDLGRELITMTGDKALLKKFDALTSKDARKVARKALTYGSGQMRDAIRGQIKPATTPGHSATGLKRNIGSRLKRSKKTDTTEALAGVGVGKKKTKGAPSAGAPHFHLEALGTRDRWTGHRTRRTGRRSTGKPVAFRGRMQGDDFVGRAYASKGGRLVSEMVEIMRTGIEQAGRG